MIASKAADISGFPFFIAFMSMIPTELVLSQHKNYCDCAL